MNKPKPTSFEEHKFEEERARRILMYCFPEKYLAAQLAESPDIIIPSLSIGVEVTESICQAVQQNMSRASDITGKTLDELSAINKRNIEEGRVIAKKTPNGQYIAGFSMWGNFHDLFSAYIKKTEKLNANHFVLFEENNLLLLSWMIDDEELESGILKILQYHSESSEKEYAHTFDNVYICVDTRLIHIAIKDRLVIPITIPAKIMSEISEISFFEVFGVTRDRYYLH